MLTLVLKNFFPVISIIKKFMAKFLFDAFYFGLRLYEVIGKTATRESRKGEERRRKEGKTGQTTHQQQFVVLASQ